jgi:nicotinate dehydrogenase subunit A
MSDVSLTVNGRTHVLDVDPECPLLYVLRNELQLTGPEFGCGLGQCGACTVLVDNRPTRSCQLPVSRAAGRAIVTIEGLGTPEQPHALQTAFIAEQSFQCGYCLSGWVLTAKALLDATPEPSDDEMKRAFQTLICRCGSHARVFAGVRRAVSDAKRSA